MRAKHFQTFETRWATRNFRSFRGAKAQELDSDNKNSHIVFVCPRKKEVVLFQQRNSSGFHISRGFPLIMNDTMNTKVFK